MGYKVSFNIEETHTSTNKRQMLEEKARGTKNKRDGLAYEKLDFIHLRYTLLQVTDNCTHCS
jgi:hypothetical protein